MFDFLFLAWLHIVADSTMQTDRQSSLKRTVLRHLVSHVAVWTGMISLGLWVLGLWQPWKVLFLFLGHLAIDKLLTTKADPGKIGFIGWVDQGLHLAQIAVVML